MKIATILFSILTIIYSIFFAKFNSAAVENSEIKEFDAHILLNSQNKIENSSFISRETEENLLMQEKKGKLSIQENKNNNDNNKLYHRKKRNTDTLKSDKVEFLSPGPYNHNISFNLTSLINDSAKKIVEENSSNSEEQNKIAIPNIDAKIHELKYEKNIKIKIENLKYFMSNSIPFPFFQNRQPILNFTKSRYKKYIKQKRYIRRKIFLLKKLASIDSSSILIRDATNYVIEEIENFLKSQNNQILSNQFSNIFKISFVKNYIIDPLDINLHFVTFDYTDQNPIDKVNKYVNNILNIVKQDLKDLYKQSELERENNLENIEMIYSEKLIKNINYHNIWKYIFDEVLINATIEFSELEILESDKIDQLVPDLRKNIYVVFKIANSDNDKNLYTSYEVFKEKNYSLNR